MSLLAYRQIYRGSPWYHSFKTEQTTVINIASIALKSPVVTYV